MVSLIHHTRFGEWIPQWSLSDYNIILYYTLLTERSRLAFGPVDQPKALLGDEVKLECRADFNPILDLVYLWYHNDRCKCV